MTVTISVVVPSGIPGIRWIVVIDFTIAVIINTAIAIFLSAGVDQRVGVITIRRIRTIPGGAFALG